MRLQKGELKIKKAERLSAYYKEWVGDPAIKAVDELVQTALKTVKGAATHVSALSGDPATADRIPDFVAETIDLFNDEYFDRKDLILPGLEAQQDTSLRDAVPLLLEDIQDKTTVALSQVAVDEIDIEGDLRLARIRIRQLVRDHDPYLLHTELQ